MKKAILLLFLVLSTASFAQTKAHPNQHHSVALLASDSTKTTFVDTPKVYVPKYYFSGGVGYSAQVVSYGVEGGYFNDKIWIGGSISTSRNTDLNRQETYIGPKFYYLIDHVTKTLDFYAYSGVYVGLFKKNPLELETGISVVYNITPHWAPQFNVSAPIYEHNSEVNPAVSLSLNYFF